MIRLLPKIAEAVYWWGVRRWNNTKARLGWASYPEVKEFVYLDRTALISLLASTTGGITQQKTTSKKQRISSSIKGSLGPIGASVGSEESRSNETVQKYVVQSNFKELYEMRKDDITISDHADLHKDVDIAVPEKVDAESIFSESLAKNEKLHRGDLVEMRATLQSSDIYEYFLVFDAFEDIVESFSSEAEFRRQLQQQGVSADEIAMMLELMEILMAGLIPIECHVSEYGVYEIDGEKIIVSKDWADKNHKSIDDLYLAGFIDEENLWQEPSRVLFSENEFTIYGRLDDPSPTDNWSPLKLVDILNTVFPEIANSIENLPSELEESDISERESIDFRDTIRDYLIHLETEAADDFPQGTIEGALDRLENPLDAASREEREKLLREAEDALKTEIPESDLNDYGLNSISRKRADFLEENSLSDEEFNSSNSNDEDKDKTHLEMNFIAIYW